MFYEKEDYYEIPVPNLKNFVISSFNYYPKSKEIKIAGGGQGLKVVNTKYKVLWRYANPDKFYFVEGNNVLPKFQQFCIGSNNKEEIIYLLALLNSQLNELVLDMYLRNENEKDILVGVKAIKEFIRVPKINEDNQPIKEEVIERTEEMLSLEDRTLSDFVDFSKVMVQKFDSVSVEGNSLILEKDEGNKIRIPIKGNNILVKKVIGEKYNEKGLRLEEQKISISELKALPVIDFEKQKELKDYIDDLVFVLYFKIPIKDLGINKAKEIRSKCKEHPHYKLVSNQTMRH